MEEIIYHQEMVRVKAPPLVNYVGLHMVVLNINANWNAGATGKIYP